MSWIVSSPFTHAGYQQGEGAVLRSPDGKAKVDILIQYSPLDDPLRVVREGIGVKSGAGAYILAVPQQVAQDGRPGSLVYFYEALGQEDVVLSYRFQLRPEWILGVGARLYSPYDPEIAAEVRAIVDSLQIR